METVRTEAESAISDFNGRGGSVKAGADSMIEGLGAPTLESGEAAAMMMMMDLEAWPAGDEANEPGAHWLRTLPREIAGSRRRSFLMGTVWPYSGNWGFARRRRGCQVIEPAGSIGISMAMSARAPKIKAAGAKVQQRAHLRHNDPH
jgi:hypothetical protein